MRSIRHWLRGLLAASSLFAGVAAAQTYEHSAYLDLDNNTATGCNVATAAGPVNGAEVRITASVTGTPPMVTGVTRAQCAGGVFGAAQPISGSYAVGLNNGLNGSDVIEIGTSLAGLGQGGPALVTFVSVSAGGADLAAGLVQLPGGGAVGPTAPILVPATGIIALLAIAGLVLILARRHPAFGSSVVLLLMLGAGAVWAANFIVDGQVGDWAGVAPIAGDPNNDSSSSDTRIEIVAVFAATEAGNLFLRVDVLDAQVPTNNAPVLNDTAFSVAENAANATAVGTVTATDANAGQTLTYSITAGNASGAFAINAATGAITVANGSQLNFEVTTSYALTVSVSDNGAPVMSDTAVVTVNVTDVNEAPVLADATRAVAEDSAAGTQVGAPLGGTDPDAGATLAYAITAGNTNGAFAIDNAGQITVANAAEVANLGTFVLTVTLTDNGGLSDTATVTVNVTDQNDAPTFTGEPYAFALPENSGNGTVVGSTPATDSDAGQTLSFAITGGNTGGAFAIDAAGQITVANAAAVDFETNPSFALSVTVTDNGAPALSDTAAVTVTVGDVNENPVANDAAFAVAENAAIGTSVGTATATDPDIDPPNPPSPNATLSFAITAGNVGNVFAIDANTGVITTAAAPVLANSPYVLTVTVTDGGALSDTATITITVTDQNDAPTLGDAAFSLPENSANGTSVGGVAGTDPDAGQVLTYSITAGNGAGGFAIDANTGAITVANSAALDFETTPSFSLTVTATDNGAPPLSDTATVTIDLTNANDAPVANDAGFSLPENSANATVVGTYTATDPDAGQTLSYSITGGTGAAFFAINAASGQITVSDSAGLDFEAGAIRTLTITATDDGAGNLTDTGVVTVTLTDVNEAPVANDAVFSVPENSPNGTPVGTATATDVDAGANGTLSFAITAGNTNGAFAIAPATGAITVANSAEINFGASFSLTVQVTDGGALSDTATVTVSVDDVNEAPVPTAMPSATPSLPENSAIGTPVATIVPNDPEAVQTHTFAITAGNTGNAFAIDASGVITVAVVPDFEAGPTSYVLDVQVTDNGVPPLSGTVQVTVTITDVNEAPSFTSAATANTAEGTTGVLTVTTTDPESDTITYGIAGGVDSAFFSIDSGTGVLTFVAAPDFDSPADSGGNNVYDVIVSAADGTNTPTQAIAVTVTNVNDAPVFTSGAAVSVPENTLVVTTVTATDADVADTVTYSITGGADAALFSIDGNSGALSFNSAPNFESPADAGGNNVYDVIVTATDGTASPTQAIAVTVTDANEAPTITSANAFSVPENSTAVATVTTTDPEGNTITYSITGGADQGLFTIDANTGALSFVAGPNFEAPADAGADNVYDVQVTATDGTNPVAQSIAVTVTGVDEPASFTSSATPSAPENQTAVTTVVATDPEGTALTYSITGGADAALFSIVPATGVLTFNAAPDFEAPADADTNNTYLVDVTATDGSNPIVQNLTVTVTNVNEAPVLADQARSIDENSANGTAVGAALAFSDPDAGQTFVFAITAGNTNGAFAVDSSGQITVANSAELNFEVTTSYSLTVTVTDNGVPMLGDGATVTVTINNVNEAPLAVTDNYNYIGNTELRIDGHAGIASALAFTTDADNPLDNDTDPDSPASGFATLSVTPVTGGNSANGGRYDIAADGTVRYTPPAGFSGTDTITYQLTDGTNAVNGTLSFTMTGTDMVWYTRNDDPTADGGGLPTGTSSYPFNTLSGASTASQVNHIVYVHSGDGGTTGQNAGIVLKNGQKLWGQGIALTVNGGTTLIAAGAQPQIGNGAGVGVSATNLTGVQVRGLNIAGSTDAIAAVTNGANSGGIEIGDNTIRAAGNEGIDIDGGGTGTFALSLHDLVVTSVGNAIDINRTAGTVAISAFDDLTVGGNTGGDGIVVNVATFDAVPGGGINPISGGVLAIGDAANAVGGDGMLLTNVQGDLHFNTNMTVFAAAGAGVSVSGTGGGMTLRVNSGGAPTGIVQATGGPAIEAASTALDLRLTDLESTNSATTGVSLTGVTGTLSAETGSQIVNAAGTDFAISGGTANVTYRGTITDDVGQLVSVANATAGTKIFEGAITDGNDADGSGISLTNNTGATIRFNGGLLLSTSANPAFVATGGGTVEVCDEIGCNGAAAGGLVNTIVTTTATALNVANTNIGAGRLEFRSISSNGGGSAGIVLNTTGAAGGLIVRGNAGTCTSAGTCTGGAIQNKTVDGITLTNTQQVSLSNMFIDNNDGSGIFGDDVTGLTLANCRVTNSADTATGTEANLRFNELLGTSSITNCVFSGAFEDQIRMTPASGTGTLTITNSTVGPGTPLNGNGLTLSASGTANMTLNISGGAFLDVFATALSVNGINTSVRTLSVSGTNFSDSNTALHLLGSDAGDIDYSVAGGTYLRHGLNPLQIVSGSTSTNALAWVGDVTGVAIGDGSANSGATDLHGIAIEMNGDADSTQLANNNNVRNTDIDGIFMQARLDNDADAETGRADLTLRDNTVGTPDDNSAFPFGAAYGMRIESRNTYTLCMDMAGNTSGSVGGLEHIRVRQRDTAEFHVERLTDGDGTPNEELTNLATVESHLVGQNDPGTTVDATQQTVADGYREAANGFCRKP